ncbi:hypothetical protein FXO37_35075 [Capsicum annuum]|nr:hypothetical protein FXO37_35075 [Capsicum annuum]
MTDMSELVNSEVGCLIVNLRATTYIDIVERCLYLVIFFLSVYVARTLQKYQWVRVGFSKRMLIGAKRTRLHGESDDWKKFPIPPGFESSMSFTLQKVKNNEKARKSTAVGESEQDPSQAASTSTIIGIGKFKSSIRCWPWILDDHVDHIEEDSGCETDKNEKNTMASAIVVVTELPVYQKEVVDIRRISRGGQTGETMRTGCVRAKSVCYSPWFRGWARGLGVLWFENQLGLARVVGDHPSVVCPIFYGHLGGQTGETPQTGHIRAKSVSYSPRFRGWSWSLGVLLTKWCEWGIFGPNGCVIAHGFGDRPGVRACCGPKINCGMSGRLGIIPVCFGHGPGVRVSYGPKVNWGMPRRLGIIPVWQNGVNGAFSGQIDMLIAHGFGGRPGVRVFCRSKSATVCHRYWGSSQCGPFKFSWEFGLTNKRNYANGAFFGQRCAIAHSFGGGPEAQGTGVLRAKNQPTHASEVGDHPSVAKSVGYGPRFLGWVLGPGALWAENRSRHAKEVGNHPSMPTISGVGLGFERAIGQNLTGVCHGGWGSSQCGSFQFLWPFGWTNRRNGVNRAFLGKIGVVWAENQPRHAREVVDGTSMVDKMAKRHESSIFAPNQCSIAYDFRGGPGRTVDEMAKQRELGIFGLNRCSIAYGFMGGPGRTEDKRAKRGEQSIFGPNRCNIAHGFGDGLGVRACYQPKNDKGCAREVGDYLSGQTRETVPMGHFWAKSVSYSHGFGGGPGVRTYCGTKIDQCMPGKLGIIPVCVEKWEKRHEQGIFGLNWCAIAQGFEGGSRVRSYCRPKINRGMPGKLGIIPCALAHDFGGGPGIRAFCGPKIDQGIPGRLGIIPIWVDKWVKRCERGIFDLNQCAIGHGFGGGPRSRHVAGQKLTEACQRGWGSSQYDPFKYSWPFGWTNIRNSLNGIISCQIAVLLPTILGVGLRSGVLWTKNLSRHATKVRDYPSVVRLNFHGQLDGQTGETAQTGYFLAKSVDKWAKRRERGIFRTNRCAVSNGFGDGPKVDKRVKRCEREIFMPNWCDIDHDLRGGPGVHGVMGQKMIRTCQGGWGSSQYGWRNGRNGANHGSGMLRAKNKPGRARDSGDHPRLDPGFGRAVVPNQPRHAKEVKDHPSVIRLNCCGYLGGQTSENGANGAFSSQIRVL